MTYNIDTGNHHVLFDYGDILYSHAACSTLKQLDAVYHCALLFITGNINIVHITVHYMKKTRSKPSIWQDGVWSVCYIVAKLLQASLVMSTV